MANGLRLLPIETRHLYALDSLPYFKDHADPFDRLLIAQAAGEACVLLSADQKMSQHPYPVQVMW